MGFANVFLCFITCFYAYNFKIKIIKKDNGTDYGGRIIKGSPARALGGGRRMAAVSGFLVWAFHFFSFELDGISEVFGVSEELFRVGGEKVLLDVRRDGFSFSAAFF